MHTSVVETEGLELSDDRELLSPPWLSPVYQCAKVVTAWGFLPHADLEVEVDGATVVVEPVGFPEPVGATLELPASLVAGQVIRVRQLHTGRTSDWSSPVTVLDHTIQYPAGPPRPGLAPTPLHRCGSRTGVDNLLGGGNVWITADGAEVGRVDGCASPMQGVNVEPSYELGQHIRAHFELCGDQSAPSVEHVTQSAPSPLPTPAFDPFFEGQQQLRLSGIANGAKVSVVRSGPPSARSGAGEGHC